MRHKILSSSRTSREHRVLADVLLKNFVAAAVFWVSYFLNVAEEFRSCLSKPEGSVCHFWTFYVNQEVVCFSLFAIFEPTDPLGSRTKRAK